MADCGTPFSRRRAVSLERVRTTGGESADGVARGERALRAVRS